MLNHALISWEQMRSDPQKGKDIPFSTAVKEALWKTQVSIIGQWELSQDEMDLLNLYVREGTTKRFIECLFPKEGGFWSKGKHYFKAYSKHYGVKDFMAFTENLVDLLDRVFAVKFEKDDLSLRAKVSLVIAEELLNHLCWGLYLVYMGGGVRNDFHVKNVTPDEISAMENAMLLSARIYMELLTRENPEISDWGQKILKALANRNLGFISTLAGKGGRGVDGSFFRLRYGCHELQNAIHALKIQASFSLPLDFMVGPFYSSLTCAALAYAALLSTQPNLNFTTHVYSAYEDHVKIGEWEDKKRRDILARISQIPPFVRPYASVMGKRILLVTNDLGDGKALLGLAHFYEELGAQAVYTSAVEAKNNQMDFASHQFQGREITVLPTFLSAGPSALRHRQKEIEESNG